MTPRALCARGVMYLLVLDLWPTRPNTCRLASITQALSPSWAHLSKPISATILQDIPDPRERGPYAEMSMESSPQAIYRAEKDKALRERRITHLQLMQEAQEAFRKMLADAQLARKGGRPKSANTPAAAAAAAAKKKAAATKSVTEAVPVTVTPAVPPTPVSTKSASP